MLLQKLKINYFGRFTNKEIELKPGINLIYGENESGKSTVHTFIKGMLFGIERLRGRASASKEDLYTRYLPWDYPGAFGGSMDIEIEGKRYRLTRSFHTSDKSFTVLELATGRELKLKEGLISELVPGLTESAYRNTISLEQQKTQTDSELAIQVRNYIANLSVAKSKEIDVAKALSSLTEWKKQLEPSQNPMALKALQAEIEEGLEKEEKIDRLTLQLKALLEQEKRLNQEKEEEKTVPDQEAVSRMEQLPAILEKYRSYRDLSGQLQAVKAQSAELKNKMKFWQKDTLAIGQLREDKKAIESCITELTELEHRNPELKKEQERRKKAGMSLLLASLLPAAALSVILVLATGFQTYGLLLGALVLLGGVVGYAILGRKNKEQLRRLEAEQSENTGRRKEKEKHYSEILQRYQVASVQELAGKQEELSKSSYALEHAAQQQEELEKRCEALEDSSDILYDSIMKYLRFYLPDSELSDPAMELLQEELRLKKQEGDHRQIHLKQQQEELRLEIAKLRWEISTLEGNEGQLIHSQERLKQLVQQQKESAVELEAIKLALGSIQELSLEIHDSFGQELNYAVSKVIKEVTGSKYKELKIDEKLDVKVECNGDYVLLERLSAGTIDQVYFALRLAVADLLLGKDQVPLLLDDSFALYDDVRVKAALSELATRKQILLFTCHNREQRLLTELGLPYHYIDLSTI